MDERTLFLKALEADDPGAREALLKSACADDLAMHENVRTLLRSHSTAGTFLQTSVLEQSGMAAETPVSALETQGAGDTRPVRDPLTFLSPSQRPDSLGRVGHYEVLQLIGRGGMGLVLRAFDEKLKREVAIKVVSGEFAASPQSRQRFVREAQAAAAISHDNVVTIYAVEDEGSVPFLVMQLVDGQSLEERLRAEGSLEAHEVARIGMQIAAGLVAAHKRGLIHRDIKPANILLERAAKQVKITDFGLARASDDAGLTQSGMISGTPMYMSPEQAQDATIDARSDLFSLGSLMYALCVGRPPFRGSTMVAVLRGVCDDAPRPIAEINPDIPAWLCEIIDKLLAKRPADRFQTASEVAHVLSERLAQPQPPANSTSSTLSQVVVPSRGSRRRWPIIAGALAASLLLAGIIFIQTPRGQIVIETDDPEISFHVTTTGVRLEDRKADRQYDLKVARHDPQTEEYELEVSDEAAGVNFTTKKFVIRRGERVAVQAFYKASEPSDVRNAIATPPAPGSPTEILTSDAWEWSAPENLGSGVNTPGPEQFPSLTEDGLMLVFARGADLFVSRRASIEQPFAPAERLPAPIYSDKAEKTPAISGDGLLLMFSSDRGGNEDLWMATRASQDEPWNAPKLLENVNMPGADRAPCLSLDGLTLVCSSFRPNGLGMNDFWMWTRRTRDEAFTHPTNLGPHVNTRTWDGGCTLSADGRTLLFIRSFQPPHKTLWIAVRTGVGEPFTSAFEVGPPLKTAQTFLGVTLSADGRTLYMHSDRAGTHGSSDLWVSRRVPSTRHQVKS